MQSVLILLSFPTLVDGVAGEDIYPFLNHLIADLFLCKRIYLKKQFLVNVNNTIFWPSPLSS